MNKIKSKYVSLELKGDNLIMYFYNICVNTKFIYTFIIEKMEDIEKLKEFFKEYKKSYYINFKYDSENEKVKIEYESKKISKIINSIIIDVIN